LLPLEENETVKTVLPVAEFEEGKYILTATRRGVVKKTDLMAYSRVLSVGIIALSLKEGDELVTAKITSGEDYVFMTSRAGQAILFSEQDVRPMGRTASGVFGMRFKGDDDLVSMTVVPKDTFEASQVEESELDETLPLILTVTQRGYGKRTPLNNYPVQGRGGYGVITIKTSERNGEVVGARLVEEVDELMLITNTGQIIRMRVSDISIIGRNTQGVRLMSMDEEELVVGLAKVVNEDEEEEEGEEVASEESGEATEAAAGEEE